MIQCRLFLLRDIDFIHGAHSDLKLCWMFAFTSSMRGNIQTSLIGAQTARGSKTKSSSYASKQYKFNTAVIVFLSIEYLVFCLIFVYHKFSAWFTKR